MTKSIEDLKKYLITLSKEERIEEIGNDLISNERKYSELSTYFLAEVLDIDVSNPYKWDFFHFYRTDDPITVLIRYFDDYHDEYLDYLEFLNLKDQDKSMVNNIKSKFRKLIENGQTILDNNILDDDDYEFVSRLIVEKDKEQNINYEPIAEIIIESKKGGNIKFQATVECDGSLEDLCGPYDEHISEENGIIVY